jgi:hypothetical protein
LSDPESSGPPGRSRRGLALRRLGLLGGSFLVSLLLAECVLRVAWRNPYRGEGTDWVLLMRMAHPDKNMPVDRSAVDPKHPIVWMRTDDRGYLLPSRRFADPDATIAFLGGSTTECSAVSGEDRFPALVSKRLEQRGLRVNTLNAGRSGNTTHDAVNLLFNHVVQDGPGVAVLMEAANDFGVLAQDPSYRTRSDLPMTIDVPMRWLAQSLSSRSSVVGALRYWSTIQPPKPRAESKRPGRELQVSPAPFEQSLRSFVGICRAFGIVPVLMTQPFAPTRTRLTPSWTSAQSQLRFNDSIRAVAASEGVVLIDLAKHVEQDVPDWERPMNVFYDGIHVTDHGSHLYAEYITARLLASIPALQGVSPTAR